MQLAKTPPRRAGPSLTSFCRAPRTGFSSSTACYCKVPGGQVRACGACESLPSSASEQVQPATSCRHEGRRIAKSPGRVENSAPESGVPAKCTPNSTRTSRQHEHLQILAITHCRLSSGPCAVTPSASLRPPVTATANSPDHRAAAMSDSDVPLAVAAKKRVVLESDSDSDAPLAARKPAGGEALGSRDGEASGAQAARAAGERRWRAGAGPGGAVAAYRPAAATPVHGCSREGAHGQEGARGQEGGGGETDNTKEAGGCGGGGRGGGRLQLGVALHGDGSSGTAQCPELHAGRQVACH